MAWMLKSNETIGIFLRFIKMDFILFLKIAFVFIYFQSFWTNSMCFWVCVWHLIWIFFTFFGGKKCEEIEKKWTKKKIQFLNFFSISTMAESNFFEFPFSDFTNASSLNWWWNRKNRQPVFQPVITPTQT